MKKYPTLVMIPNTRSFSALSLKLSPTDLIFLSRSLSSVITADPFTLPALADDAVVDAVVLTVVVVVVVVVADDDTVEVDAAGTVVAEEAGVVKWTPSPEPQRKMSPP